MAFDLDQATHNALARVTYHIRACAEEQAWQLTSHALRLRSAWRTRHFEMQRDLRGIAFYPTHQPILNKD